MKHFTIDELCRSETAQRKGINNMPTDNVRKNLTAYGKSIYVNSGYRCPALNKAVGGVANSQHLTGQAADIDTNDTAENRRLMKHIEDNLDFDQLIWENGGAWLHVSYRADGKNRRQVLRT